METTRENFFLFCFVLHNEKKRHRNLDFSFDFFSNSTNSFVCQTTTTTIGIYIGWIRLIYYRKHLILLIQLLLLLWPRIVYHFCCCCCMMIAIILTQGFFFQMMMMFVVVIVVVIIVIQRLTKYKKKIQSISI